MDYFINGTNLKTLGVEVALLRGFESFPKRKGRTKNNYLNENGVEAFTEESDTFYDSRKLFLDVVIVSDTIAQAQANMDALFQLIKVGELTITSTRLSKAYVTFFESGAEFKSKTKKIVGKQCYEGTVHLTEINPMI